MPRTIWVDLSMNFILALPRSRRGNDSIMVVVDMFSKKAYFIACKNIFGAPNIACLFFNKIICLYGVPRCLNFDIDVKFIGYFWWDLWRCLCTDINLSSAYLSIQWANGSGELHIGKHVKMLGLGPFEAMGWIIGASWICIRYYA